MHETAIGFAMAVLVVGCGSPPQAEDPDRLDPRVRVNGQSYLEALQMICDVDRLSRAGAGGEANSDAEDPLAAATGREAYLMDHVKNPDGRYFLTLFRTKGPAERAAMLQTETVAAKLKSCPLITSLRADAG